MVTSELGQRDVQAVGGGAGVPQLRGSRQQGTVSEAQYFRLPQLNPPRICRGADHMARLFALSGVTPTG